VTNLYCTFVYESIDVEGNPMTIHEGFPPIGQMQQATQTMIRSAAFERLNDLEYGGRNVKVIMPEGFDDD
jgi:hypothetical protein